MSLVLLSLFLNPHIQSYFQPAFNMALLTEIVQLSTSLYTKYRLRFRVLCTRSKQLPLLTLPPELIISISSHLITPDHFALARVNKQFYELLTPLLYQRAAHELRPSTSTSFQWDPTPGRTLLHFAAAHGNTKLLREILQRSTEAIDTADAYGMTPLTSAVAWGHKSTVTLLLGAGADTERRCLTHGWTALHLAAVCWNAEIARLLVWFGADNGARDLLGGFTPAHLVSCSRENWPDRNELLMAVGVKIPVVDNLGHNVDEVEKLMSWIQAWKSIPKGDIIPGPYNTQTIIRGLKAMASLKSGYTGVLKYETDRCRWCARGMPWKSFTEASRCHNMIVLTFDARRTARWGMSGCEERLRSRRVP